MSDLSDIVVGVVALNDGQLVGKTRLQKTIFLLEACGLECGIDFDYHNFGPFSSDVAIAVDDARDMGLLRVDERYGYHAVPYAIFETEENAPQGLGNLSAATVRRILQDLSQYSALELEVAATVHYLRETEYGDDAIEEVKVRKPVKASRERLERSLQLLGGLGLG